MMFDGRQAGDTHIYDLIVIMLSFVRTGMFHKGSIALQVIMIRKILLFIIFLKEK
jgi:hypothetical protein